MNEKSKEKHQQIAAPNISEGELFVVINDGEKPVSLSRAVSYQPELHIDTVMRVVEFLAEHDNATNIDFLANNLHDLNPIQVGKSLITLEQKGLVELNAEKNVVKRI